MALGEVFRAEDGGGETSVSEDSNGLPVSPHPAGHTEVDDVRHEGDLQPDGCNGGKAGDDEHLDLSLLEMSKVFFPILPPETTGNSHCRESELSGQVSGSSLRTSNYDSPVLKHHICQRGNINDKQTSLPSHRTD